MTEELRAAVDGLYVAFATYARLPRPLYLEGADPVGFGASLDSKPLRLLGPTDVARFAFKSMTTWGGIDDFRHYLPRLFELLAKDGGGSWIDPEVVFGKLPYGRWRGWPAGEQRAVETYVATLWADVSTRCPHPFEVASCLCCIGLVVGELRPYLAQWNPRRSWGEAMQFASFLSDVAPINQARPKRPWVLGGAWWGETSAAQQVTDWLLSSDRRSDLEEAFYTFGMADDATARALSDAMNQLSLIGSLAG